MEERSFLQDLLGPSREELQYITIFGLMPVVFRHAMIKIAVFCLMQNVSNERLVNKVKMSTELRSLDPDVGDVQTI